MIPLVLATLGSGAFGIVLRLGQREACDLALLAAVNYLTATLYSLATAAVSGAAAPHAATLALGGAGGVAYVTTFYLLSALMHRRGVTIGAAVIRLAAVIPVALSILLWKQTASPWEMSGGAVALASLPLLSLRPRRARGSPGSGGLLMILAVFLGQGGCLAATLVFSQVGERGEDPWFLAALFGTAAVVSLAAWGLRGRGRIEGGRAGLTLGLGALLGGCNVLGNQFLIIALRLLPGMLVYPFQAAVGLLLTVVFSRIAWSERIGVGEAAGIVLACVSVALVNVR